MTYDPYACQRRQQPPKQDCDDGYDVAGGEYFNKTVSIMPVDEEVSKQKEQTKPCASELTRREKVARITAERSSKPFGGYPSIKAWCKANGIKEHVHVWRSQSLWCRGFKREDITPDDILYYNERHSRRHTTKQTSFPQNVDNSKLDTSAIKQAVQQEGEFKCEEDKANEKLDETTQFESNENTKKFTTDDYLDKLGQKYNESRIGDLEVEVRQLRKDFDNIKAMIAKLDKLEFAGAGDARLRTVIKRLLKEILIELND